MRIVGRLHPGEMGASIGAALRRAGVQVLWVSAARGAATRRRAQAADLTDVGTLPALVVRSQLVMSVCPAHAAVEVAGTVAALGFEGTYWTPTRSRRQPRGHWGRWWSRPADGLWTAT